ncbi:nucleoid-associated protein [Chryseobacterium sp. T9W2-O]|uniref:Nucleoid-associated protein n=2 Tax=Chryseobacterium salviniae TaxID=3101750 RepID=A0ABU6HSC8_9FLAO|nr:nucleoid-associated protein [Chryseobacterium sp. T9W2-O]MEC3875961.1 nucleoid-associated protein [Chryseobacterium sp. T9W2-O]
MNMKIALHIIGNKILGEGAGFSDEELTISEETQELLHNYFLGSFKSEETYQFYSDSYLENNIAYKVVSEMFREQSLFIDNSRNLGRLLYDAAENPRIQGGELFVVYFEAEDESEVDKIGIFKTEKREPFLKILPANNEPIEVDKGVSLAKIDKAALIFNKDKETGYVLQVVDNNKNGDMYYWFEDFLKVRQREDDYFHTSESLTIFKDYVKKQLPVEFEVSKADQADFLNKSINFFKEKEEFKLEEFTHEVFEDKAVIESFNNFKTDYEQDMQVNVAEEFPINTSAVKKSQKHFKSIIKLDKNFHLYIHGDRKMLESGTDEKGNFYKVYFEKES